MKRFSFLVVLACVFQSLLFAQNTQQKSKTQVWLYLQNPKSKHKVAIEQLRDSSILVCALTPPVFDSYDIPVSRIGGIKWHKKNRIWKGMGLGVACGIGIGVLVGIIGAPAVESSDLLKFESPHRNVKYAIWGGLAGTLVGGFVGSVDVRIPINGSQSDYRRQKAKLRKIITCQQ